MQNGYITQLNKGCLIMSNFEVRRHKVDGLKGGVNLVVWYKGKVEKEFIVTVYPSQLSVIDFIESDLKESFEKHLRKRLHIFYDEV